jgi:ATP-dependent DNA ligase
MLIQPTSRGLYCAAGDFYIDPWQPVDRAVITHEIREVDSFVRRNTVERFGPVRFPRMLRMRKDKTIADANTLEDAVRLAGFQP